MKKKTLYIIAGLAVAAVAGIAVFGGGQLFQGRLGNLNLGASRATPTAVKTTTSPKPAQPAQPTTPPATPGTTPEFKQPVCNNLPEGMGTMPFLSVAPGLSGWVTASVDLSIFNFRISACQNDNNPGKGEAAIHSIVVTVNKMGQISIDNLRLREGGTTVSECAEMVSNYSVSKWHCLVDNMVVIPEGVTKTYTVNVPLVRVRQSLITGLMSKLNLETKTPLEMFFGLIM